MTFQQYLRQIEVDDKAYYYYASFAHTAMNGLHLTVTKKHGNFAPAMTLGSSNARHSAS